MLSRDQAALGTKFLLGLAFVAATAVPGLRAQTRDFSARELERKGSAPALREMKVYVRGMQMRIDTNFGNDGSYELYDFAKDADYTVLPRKRAYSSTPGASLVRLTLFYHAPEDACPQMEQVATRLRQDLRHADGNIRPNVCRRIGADMVNARKTVKYEVANANDKGAVTYYWIDVRLGFLTKSKESGTGITFEYQDIKEGPQPASLFEIPADFRKLN